MKILFPWRIVRKRYVIKRRKSSKKKNADYTPEKIERVRELVHNRLSYFAPLYDVVYKKVAIRDQKTRWGSCSARGNLNFNYRIVDLTLEQADYIIVHELCHLREMNHSDRFWGLVERQIPDWKRLRNEIKAIRF